MKTLIIGEIINNNLSSGTLEILGKAKSLDLDVQVVTVGSETTRQNTKTTKNKNK